MLGVESHLAPVLLAASETSVKIGVLLPDLAPVGPTHILVVVNHRIESQMSGSSMSRSLRFAVVSQLTLGGFLALCVLVTPRFAFAANEGGVSNYGVHGATVIPYTLAFVGSASFLFLAGRALRYTDGLGRAALGFEVVALMLGVVLVSTYPYKIDRTLADVHLGAAIGLFCAELPLVAGLAFALSSKSRQVIVWLGWLGALGWLTGAAVAALTVLGFIHLLFLGQAVMSAGFAAVLVTSLQAEVTPRRTMSGRSRPQRSWSTPWKR